MKLRFVALLGVVACGGSQNPEPASPPSQAVAAPADAPPAPRADGRLPELARPLAYQLSIHLDPAKTGFTGSMKIALQVPKPTRHIVLNADGLTVDAVRLAGRAATASVREQELVISGEAPVSGEVTVEIDYHGDYNRGLEGLYVAKDAVYTDFEPVDARKAFPCFDDPSYKAPYTIRVTVPKGQTAFSNANEVARFDRGEHTEIEFAPTRPLPAYLVAIAAGKLAVFEGAKSPWPIRVIGSPDALSPERAKPALDTAAAVLSLLAEWFGVDYPYGKLDLVAVPDFGSGAMENAGLVTFREELLLVDPAKDSTRQRRAMEIVITHELAHQWFGDLVTTAWWDDIWLNEAFASFMEGEILEQWKPGYGSVLDRYVDAQRAMEMDGLPSARRVRQPVRSAGEAREAFDPITYDKGAQVLGMVQSWLGKPAFRLAISNYIKRHADGNAKAADLFAELDAAGSLATGSLSAALSAYVDQPGVPWLGESARGAWRPRGVEATTTPSWPLVHCHAPRLCAPLAAGKPADSFAFATSYVRGTPALGSRESDADKLAQQWNLWADLRGGQGTPAAEALAAWQKASFAAVKAAPSRHAVESLLLQTSWLAPALTGTPRGQAFVSALRKELGPLWKKPVGKSADDHALGRRALGYLLVSFGKDPAAQRELRSNLDKALAGKALSMDERSLAFELGASNGDGALWDKLHAAWSTSKSATDRTLLLRALLAFDDDTQLLRTLDLVKTGKMPAQDLRYVVGVLLARPEKIAMFDAWTQANWQALSEHYSLPVLARFGTVFGALCKDADIEKSKPFYLSKVAPIEGAARSVALAEQGARVCAALASELSR